MRTEYSTYVAISYLVSTLFFSTHALSFDTGFNLDFREDPGEQTVSVFGGNCGVGGVFSIGNNCGIGLGIELPDPDTTPFYQGVVTVDGKSYWHTIVGDPSGGFAMESYIERAGFGALTSFSGGRPGTFSAFSLEGRSGNGWDPLGVDPARGVDFTGNGSGDPTKAVIRQVMGDGTWDEQTSTWSCDSGEFCSEFLKDQLVFKPVISQTINDVAGDGTTMQAQFQLDMSNITYSDDTTAGTITNTVVFTDPNSKMGGNGNFNMATDAQVGRSVVTAGRYIYNNCSNPNFFQFGGSCWQVFSPYFNSSSANYQEGSYTYSDGNATNPMAYDWGMFLDPSQNL
ncbi:MAG: hypothetical protein GXP14_10440 [Gammaproteobacteria bacterium]|nr:hypothetical protein [Gammaproteobacteria bacterium]